MTFSSIMKGLVSAFNAVVDGISRLASFLFGSISQYFSTEQLESMPDLIRDLLEAPLIVLPLSAGMIGFIIYLFILWFIP